MTSYADQLNHRIIFQLGSKTSDGAGGYSITWSDAVTVWAMLVPHSQRVVSVETPFAEQLQAHQFYRCVIRYRSDISADMRVSYDGRIFNIRRVTKIDEKKEWLDILLTEGDAS